MADATPIENISLNFTSEYESASKGIDKVIGKLAELQRRIDKTSVTIKIKGVENLKQAADSTNNIDESSISKLERLTDALVRLSGVNIPDSIPNRLKSINKALKTEGISGIEKAANAVDDIVTETTTVTDTTAVSNPIEEMGVAAETYAPNFTMVAEKLSAISSASKPLSGLLSASAESLGEFGGALESIASSKPIGSYFEDLQNSMAVSGKIEAVSSSLKMAAQDMQEMKIQAGADTAFQGYVSNLTQMSQANKVFYDSAEAVNSVISRITKSAEPMPQIAGLLPSASLATTKPSQILSGLKTDTVEPIRAISNVASATPQVKVLEGVLSGVADASSKIGKNESKVKKFALSLKDLGKNNIKENFKDVGKELKGLGEKAFGASSRFGKLLGSIKRVALYRAIRAGIKMVTQGFKEGVTNLYKWSDAFDKTREFANSMDRIATAALYVKNSLGAMVAPIINYLAPALDWLADKFVVLLNIVNQFFAALTGASTYTAARKIATKFEDVGNKAGKAAKALKSFTLGIDELNIIEDNAGSGGGAGALGDVAEDWFEKRAVDSKIKAVADTVKEWAEDVHKYLKYAFSPEGIQDLMDEMDNFRNYFWTFDWFPELIDRNGDYLMELAQKYEPIKKALDGIGKVVDFINTHSETLKWMFDVFMGNLGGSSTSLFDNPITNAIKSFTDVYNKIVEIKHIIEDIITLVRAFLNGDLSIEKLFKVITSPKGQKNAIKSIGGSLWDAVESGISARVSRSSWGWLYNPLKNAFVSVKNIFSDGGEFSGQAFNKSVMEAMEQSPIKDNVKKQLDGIEKETRQRSKGIGKSVDQGIGDGISANSSLVTSKLNSITSSLSSGLKQGSLYNSAKKTGQNIVDGILKGITDKQAELIKNAQQTAADVLKAVNKKLGIKSPSREFMKTGRYIVEGLNIGISENASSTQKVLDSWAKDITIDPSNISMPSVGDIVDEVQGYIATAGTMAVTSEDKSLDQFMEETLMPILSNIAVDTKRQADKKETSEVYLDNRKVTSAVNRQNRANGFSFT